MASPPRYTSSFVGRRPELDALAELLSSGARLVTVLGGPGIGKSRLLSEFAAHFAGPKHHCDLTFATGPVAIVAALKEILQMPASQGSSVHSLDAIGTALRARGQMLLVLDNFEHLAEHAKSTIGGWLRAAPDAQFLVGSRHSLHIESEHIFELSPLPTSAPDGPMKSDAARLLLDRAGALANADDLDPEAVDTLVRALEGLPLAIELAAPRLKVMTARELLARLPARDGVLSQKSDDARHASLEAAIDGSWRLLSPDEQSVLAHCAMFRGGFTAKAAEQVLRGARSATEAAALDALQSLREKSLLVRRPADNTAGRRLAMLERVRRFALDRLEDMGKTEAGHRSHAAYFEELARGQLEADKDPMMVEQALRNERENLNLALSTLVQADSAQALWLGLALDRSFAEAGPVEAQLAALDRALSVAGGPDALRTRVRLARAHALVELGALGEASDALAQAGGHAEGHPTLAGDFSLAAAWLQFHEGATDDAADRMVTAIRAFRDSGDATREGVALCRLGTAVRATPRKARKNLLRGQRLLGGTHLRDQALGHLNTSRVCLDHAAHDLADEHVQKAMALFDEVGPRSQMATALCLVASIHHSRGALSEAAEAYGRGLQLLRETGHELFLRLFSALYGLLCYERGDLDEALEALSFSARRAREGGDTQRAQLAAAYVAAVEARLLGVSPRQPEALVTTSDADPVLLAVRRVLELHLELSHLTQHPDRVRARDASARDAACRSALATFRGSQQSAAPIEDRSMELRVFLRTIRKRWPIEDAAASDAGESAPLLIGKGGMWFSPPGGSVVQLRRRQKLRKLLGALVHHRMRTPGEPVPVATLLDALWPGDKSLPEAISNRLYVNVAKLRRLGLEGVLERKGDGYLIRGDVPVQWKDDVDR